jgi:hypothetical protein
VSLIDDVLDAVFSGGLLGGMLIGVGIMFVTYIVMQVLTGVTTDSACLRAGYRGASVDFAFNQYCVTRSDQTDLVLPLAEALRRPRKAE